MKPCGRTNMDREKGAHDVCRKARGVRMRTNVFAGLHADCAGMPRIFAGPAVFSPDEKYPRVFTIPEYIFSPANLGNADGTGLAYAWVPAYRRMRVQARFRCHCRSFPPRATADGYNYFRLTDNNLTKTHQTIKPPKHQTINKTKGDPPK